MAGMIINNPSSNSHTKEQTTSSGYHLSIEAIQEIRSQAPCPNGDPSATSITKAEIEAQRQAFIRLNGNDGLTFD